MLEELKNAARKVQGERELRSLMVDCRRLMSERGGANSVAIARQLLARYGELSDERRPRVLRTACGWQSRPTSCSTEWMPP